MANPGSISVVRLNAAIAKAVKSNLALKNLSPPPTIHFGPGIIGFILRETGKLDLPEIETIAKTCAETAGTAGPHGAAIIDGHVIVGFWPESKILTLGQ